MRRRNLKLAKVHRSYTIALAAELYGCHRNTVRHWLRQGLQVLDGAQPVMIHGTALNAFHAERRNAGKRPCEPGEIYCLPCRKPQRPLDGNFSYAPVSATSGKLTATCPGCGRLMHQRVDADRLAAFELQRADQTGLATTK